MKTIIENVIRRGGYDLTDMLRKIDVHHIEGKLTNEERDELIVLARDGADFKNSVDVVKKLLELDSRLKKIEETISNTGDDTEEYPDYIVGKWYYNGGKCTFDGEKYVCIAPEGVVCTWSPADHPPYWKLVTE